MSNGTLFLLGIMMAVMLFFGGIVLIEPIKEGTDFARSGLSCSSGGLTTGVEMTCIIVDAFLPIFVGVCLSIALGSIAVKRIREDV